MTELVHAPLLWGEEALSRLPTAEELIAPPEYLKVSAVWPLVTAWVEVAADRKSLLPSVGLIGHQRDATRFLDAAEEAHGKLLRAHDAAGLDRVRLAPRLRNMAALLYPTPRGELGDDGRVLLLAVRFDGLDAALCLYAPSEHGRGTVLLHPDVPGRKALVRIPADPTLLEFPERDIIAFKEEVEPARLETTLPTFSRRAKGSKGSWNPSQLGDSPPPVCAAHYANDPRVRWVLAR
jgi:hypothetical protein